MHLLPLFFCIFAFTCFCQTLSAQSVECQSSDWTGFSFNGKHTCYTVIRPRFSHDENPWESRHEERTWKAIKFEDAEEKCREQFNSSLVTIKSRQEYTFIRTLIINSHKEVLSESANDEEFRFWVGMRLSRNSNGTITRANWMQDNASVAFGTPIGLDHQPGQYPWGMDSGNGAEPNNVQGEENCVAIGASMQKDGLMDVRCSEKLTGYICEKARKKVCTSWGWD